MPQQDPSSAPRPQRSEIIDRRRFHQLAATVVGGAAALSQPSPQSSLNAKEGAADDDASIRVISQLPDRYHGWPTLAQAPDGELFAVCSGGRESHVCPFGRVEMMRSKDQGRTWSFPQVLLDGPIDDRDAGVLITRKGTILATTFTSLAYESRLPSILNGKDENQKTRWQGAHQRISAEERQAGLGVWMIRSDDNGFSFSQPYRCLVNSPHGPVEASDGRLIYAGKELWKKPSRIGVCVSQDDGQSWQWLAEIPTRPGDDVQEYHELHAVEAADGSLLAHIRNHNKQHHRETLQTRSTDGGKTWSVPESIGVWGLPSHLLRLKDDRLLMTYGHRRPPYGNQARVSEDNGKTWSAPQIVSGDGIGGDLGYPSTVELDNGDLVTMWYERRRDSPRAVLRQRRWQLS